MAFEVVMPQMGESIFEGTITKWLKKVGDKVAKDEPLLEISVPQQVLRVRRSAEQQEHACHERLGCDPIT